VAPPKNLAHEVGRNIISESNVKKIIIKIINTAKALNKKVAAVSDAYYLEP
jgi:DNA polymerase III alpha subunit (gram-positive type)